MNNVVLKNIRPFVDGKFESPMTMNLADGKWVRSSVGDAKEIDVKGAFALPALFALGMDFKEPVRDDVYTFKDGFQAMRRGGFYGGLYESAANPIDGIQKLSAVEQIVEKSHLNIRLLGAISEGYEGKTLAEMMELSEGGVVGFGDGNKSFGSSRFLRLALEYGAMTHKRFFFLPMDYSLRHGGLVHEGPVSDTLGMKGVPKPAETIAVYSLLEMALWAGVPLHFKQITCFESLELINRARDKNLDVTCAVDIYHLLFDEKDLFNLDPNLNLHPPVRTAKDKEALWAGVKEGSIQAISCNHIPVLRQDKEVNFEDATPGAVSLEIMLPALWTELSDRVGQAKAVDLLSGAPARIAGAPVSKIAMGEPVDLVVFSPEEQTVVSANTFVGQVQNSPLLGRTLQGRILGSYVSGLWTLG